MKRLIVTLAVWALAMGTLACSDDGVGPGTDTGATADGAQQQDKGQKTKDGPVPKLDKKAQPDKKVAPDKKLPPPDKKVAPDKKLPPDKGSSKLSCDDIGKCADVCSAKCPSSGKLACMMKCSTDCKAKGCTKSIKAYDAVYGCVSILCMFECMGGPSKGCKDCVNKKCASQTKACTAATCP